MRRPRQVGYVRPAVVKRSGFGNGQFRLAVPTVRGFAEHPDDFLVDRYEIDRDFHSVEGYVEVA